MDEDGSYMADGKETLERWGDSMNEPITTVLACRRGLTDSLVGEGFSNRADLPSCIPASPLSLSAVIWQVRERTSHSNGVDEARLTDRNWPVAEIEVRARSNATVLRQPTRNSHSGNRDFNGCFRGALDDRPGYSVLVPRRSVRGRGGLRCVACRQGLVRSRLSEPVARHVAKRLSTQIQLAKRN